MGYVLKGWFESEFEGHSVHTLHAGSCWTQPPKIKHTVRGTLTIASFWRSC